MKNRDGKLRVKTDSRAALQKGSSAFLFSRQYNADHSANVEEVLQKKTFQIDDHHEGDFHNIIDFTPDNGGPRLITIDGGSSIDTLPRKVLIVGRGLMSSLPQLISVSLGGSENLFNSSNCLSQYQVKIEQAI